MGKTNNEVLERTNRIHKEHISNMNKDTKQIIKEVEKYLIENKGIRFGQALFNLGILEIFPDTNTLRDIYYDTDKVILSKIKQ